MDVRDILRFTFVYIFTILWSIVALIGVIFDIIRYGKEYFYVKPRPVPPQVLTKGWNHAKISLSDIKLHYVHAGEDGKPLMLLLHGFPEFWHTWRKQIRHFQKDYKVVALDMRGYGDSDKPSGASNYTMAKLVKDIKEVIPALGYEQCILVGHNLGGVVAWTLAKQYPRLVSKLVVLNSPYPTALLQLIRKGHFRQLLKSWYIFFFQAPCLPEIILKSRDLAVFERFKTPPFGCRNPDAFTDEDMEAIKYTFSQPGAFNPPVNYYRRLLTRVQLDTESKVKPRTLIIWGTADVALSTELAEVSAKECNDAVVKYVKGAAHWVQNDEPEVCCRLIEDFLAE